MFGSVMENELKNTLQCLIMLWKMFINELIFFFKFIQYMKNIKYKYLITYNKKIKSKKCNDEFFLLYLIFIYSLFYKI
jgi:hypothetical protein